MISTYSTAFIQGGGDYRPKKKIQRLPLFLRSFSFCCGSRTAVRTQRSPHIVVTPLSPHGCGGIGQQSHRLNARLGAPAGLTRLQPCLQDRGDAPSIRHSQFGAVRPNSAAGCQCSAESTATAPGGCGWWLLQCQFKNKRILNGLQNR